MSRHLSERAYQLYSLIDGPAVSADRVGKSRLFAVVRSVRSSLLLEPGSAAYKGQMADEAATVPLIEARAQFGID